MSDYVNGVCLTLLANISLAHVCREVAGWVSSWFKASLYYYQQPAELQKYLARALALRMLSLMAVHADKTCSLQAVGTQDPSRRSCTAVSEVGPVCSCSTVHSNSHTLSCLLSWGLHHLLGAFYSCQCSQGRLVHFSG